MVILMNNNLKSKDKKDNSRRLSKWIDNRNMKRFNLTENIHQAQSGMYITEIKNNQKKIKLIAKILTDNEILFKKQYKFNDLRSDKNYPLSFDFAIFKEEELKCLIEYQGT